MTDIVASAAACLDDAFNERGTGRSPQPPLPVWHESGEPGDHCRGRLAVSAASNRLKGDRFRTRGLPVPGVLVQVLQSLDARQAIYGLSVTEAERDRLNEMLDT
ncbi:hypothetical protein ACIA6C_29685 [Streptomyces sp. NPDC051578]|uniref:hypothetical protein n=1 Tax=Streptomyces sp. NPDC051578 TaxID=3365662 RepID=UPI00378FB664